MKQRFCTMGIVLGSPLLAILLLIGVAPWTDLEAAEKKKPQQGSAIMDDAQKPWTGDLDGMVKRGYIRILTAFSPLFFTYKNLEQRGAAVDVGREFQKHLRRKLGKRARHLNVIFLPVPRDQLIPGLVQGRGDIAAANLTITPERLKLVDFGNPSVKNVKELVVSGQAAGTVKTFDDLVRVGLHVRRSSSYFEHLTKFNKQRVQSGKKAIPIVPADERLEDYDFLEMMNAGVIPAVIVDSHKASLWSKIYKNIKVHENLAVNSGGKIGWAVRKKSPKLLAAVNGFNKVFRQGTLLGNMIIKRYMNAKWIDNAMAPGARSRFESAAKFIRKYSTQYEFDWLMIAAQAYQESKLDQRKRSRAGAIGVMQVMPKTAADPNVGIPEVHILEKNVHAGVKYLRFLRNRYFSDDSISEVDRVLLSFGAYNAGPGNIARARRRAKRMGLDPNRWFQHVEVATARSVSHEPVIYVRNIYKYYVTYRMMEKIREGRETALEKAK